MCGLMTDLEQDGLRQTQLMSTRGEIPNIIYVLCNVKFPPVFMYSRSISCHSYM